MLIELLLQFFISIVYTKLLKGVLVKHFKAKNVQEADESQFGLVLAFLNSFLRVIFVSDRDRRVYFLHYPAEDATIEVFAKGVSGLVDLLNRKV